MDLQPLDHPKAFIDRLASDERTGRITVHLRGAKSVTGKIGPTGNHAMIVKALSGREFFDAYVRYDAITCIEVQTRA